MKQQNIWNRQKGALGRLVLTGLLVLGVTSTQAVAESINPELKTKVNEYQQKLSEWAQNPVLIKALKQANSSAAPKINNDTWKGMPESDPAVVSYQTSEAGKLLGDLQQDKSLGKLFLRDKNGNLVAGSKKPAIFNIADRPAYVNAMRGKSWSAGKAKADPTTKKPSVQVSAPVKSDGQVIGVLHTSVIAQ